jgi:hypothetical protein
MKSSQKNLWIWVGVVVLIAIVVWGFVWFSGKKTNAPSTTASTQKILYTVAPITAFPKSLILDNAILASGKYTVSSSTGTYLVRWYSSSSMDILASAYEAYLPANGWGIRSENKSSSTMRNIYATDAANSLSVTISASTAGGAGVTLLYSSGR